MTGLASEAPGPGLCGLSYDPLWSDPQGELQGQGPGRYRRGPSSGPPYLLWSSAELATEWTGLEMELFAFPKVPKGPLVIMFYPVGLKTRDWKLGSAVHYRHFSP